jgi:HPt (histidine-containing phosphotransfer) domain-containing protein
MKTTDPTTPLDSKQNALPVNLDGFREVADGEESERIELLKLYVGQLKRKLPQARAALERKELTQAASILHALTGATFTCGLEQFGAALRSLEESAKIGDAPATFSKLPHVIDYARDVDAAIAAELIHSF